jgi:TetR/AcrR family transcriptional regulator, transcriptional repressor for nem operon
MARTATEPRHTARGAATRNRIVTAAAELMRSRGVANTSLDAVLEASDASKSQLYHYFADKDDLVLAVIQRQADCVLETHNTHLRRVTSIAGLRTWRDAVVESTRKQNCAGGCPLGSLVSELAESPGSRAALADGFTQWQADIVTALEAIPVTKPRPRAELNELATVLLTSLQGGLLLAQTTRSIRPLELALDAAIGRVADRLTTPALRASPRASARRSRR